MTNTYLLEVIKALHPSERQEVTLLLASPYFNRGGNAKELILLYNVILKASPDFDGGLLDKEFVYHSVFHGQAYVQGKLEKLMADLNKILRIFILNQRYFSDIKDKQQQIDWAAWLRERGLAERSRQVMNKLKGLESSEHAESMDRYHTKLLLSEEEHLWELTQNQVKGDLNIPHLINQIDLYYYNYRTELVNRYLLQQKVTQLPELEFEKSSIQSLKKESLLLLISTTIFEILKNDASSAEDVQDLMQILRKNEKRLSFQTLDHFYTYLRNFCTFLINGGNSAFVPVLHQINKENLDSGYFFVFNKLPAHAYLNLVRIAILAKDFEWAKRFTEENKAILIVEDEGQFYYRLNMAQCLFAEGKFEEALKYIPDVSSNFHYHHMVRRLELKIYYELDSELLLYKHDAFRKFIERTAPKTIAANLREMDLNFLNILLQLSQSPKKDKGRSARLLKRIEDKKLLADRSWLIEKAKELA